MDMLMENHFGHWFIFPCDAVIYIQHWNILKWLSKSKWNRNRKLIFLTNNFLSFPFYCSPSHEDFIQVLREKLNNPLQKINSKLELQVKMQYKRQIRNSTDPYKKAVSFVRILFSTSSINFFSNRRFTVLLVAVIFWNSIQKLLKQLTIFYGCNCQWYEMIRVINPI